MAARWEWRNNDFTFVSFHDEDRAALEKAWAQDLDSIDLVVQREEKKAGTHHAGLKYRIDFSNMTQTNLKTEKDRLIRRVGPDGSIESRAPTWEWETTPGSGKFQPYDAVSNTSIERSFMKNDLMIKLKLATGAHDTVDMLIHFGHMHQENVATKGVRRIRRRMGSHHHHSAHSTQKTAATAGGGVEVSTEDEGQGEITARQAALKTKTKKDEEKTSSPKKSKEGGEEEAGGKEDVTALGKKRKRADLEEQGGEEEEQRPRKAGGQPWTTIPPASSLPLKTATPKKWNKHESIICYYSPSKIPTAEEGGKKGKIKIASFDLDDTLVVPKSGAVFAKNATDWKWLTENVQKQLSKLESEGYHLVIFSNQMGIAKKGVWSESTANEQRHRFEAVINGSGVALSAVAATAEDDFRKPGIKMLEFYMHQMLGVPISQLDLSNSIYCGDAAGRKIQTLANRKKDFSCSDRKFAYNCGLTFYTPEEFFEKRKPVSSFGWDGLGPEDLKALPTEYAKPTTPYATTKTPSTPSELVIFVGFPACGKSTFYRRFFQPHGYVHVNRDTLKSLDKCIAVADKELSVGKSVVIDNTSPSADDRQVYLKMAKKRDPSTRVRCFYFTASRELSFHMNVVRARLGITPRISSIAYNIFQGKFEKPDQKAEGLDEVVEIHPVMNFDGLPEEAERIFMQLT